MNMLLFNFVIHSCKPFKHINYVFTYLFYIPLTQNTHMYVWDLKGFALIQKVCWHLKAFFCHQFLVSAC